MLALVLAACGQAGGSADRQNAIASPHERKIMLAIYRDAAATMLVALPEGPGGLPQGDCAQPLLMDAKTGAAHAITHAEAAARQETMYLAGAAESSCPDASMARHP